MVCYSRTCHSKWCHFPMTIGTFSADIWIALSFRSVAIPISESSHPDSLSTLRNHYRTIEGRNFFDDSRFRWSRVLFFFDFLLFSQAMPGSLRPDCSLGSWSTSSQQVQSRRWTIITTTPYSEPIVSDVGLRWNSFELYFHSHGRISLLFQASWTIQGGLSCNSKAVDDAIDIKDHQH
jgi:hypothetical protein